MIIIAPREIEKHQNCIDVLNLMLKGYKDVESKLDAAKKVRKNFPQIADKFEREAESRREAVKALEEKYIKLFNELSK